MRQLLVCLLAAILAMLAASQGPGEAQAAKTGLTARSGLVVVVELIDAKGKALVVRPDETASLFLWRHFGDWHPSADCHYDWANSRVVCGGVGGRGLEPGKYTLEGSPGNYGGFRFDFEVSAGKPLAHRYQFKTWRQILTIECVDQKGNPLAEIAREPSYYYSWEQVTGFDRVHMPSVLRNPPGPSGGAGGFRSRQRPNLKFTRNNKYQTDSGKWYVAVIAGNPGTLSLYQDIKERFDGESWSKPYRWEIEVEELWDAHMAKATVRNADDPGRRSLLGQPAEAKAAWTIHFDTGNERLVPFVSAGKVTRTGPTSWDAAIPTREAVQYCFSGGPLCQTILKPMQPPEEGDSVTVKESSRFGMIELESPPGTLREFWDWAFFSTDPYNDDNTYDLPVGSDRVFRSLVSPESLAAMEASGYVHARLGGSYTQNFVPNMHIIGRGPEKAVGDRVLRGGHTNVILDEPLAVTSAQIATMREGGTVRLQFPFSGLILRAVTPDGAGLPLAEATIMPLESEPVALRVKEREYALAKEGKRPSLKGIDREVAEQLRLADDKVPDAKLSEWMGKEVFEAFADRETRLHFGKHGAWYDTRLTLDGDEHGYAVGARLNLVPDRKYVLYLWGTSRGDLSPDLRVEFTYTAKGVDLGALVIPDSK